MLPTIHRIKYFYPRPPGGGRLGGVGGGFVSCYFYPRPPGGGRPSPKTAFITSSHFYPRPPGGGRRVERIHNVKERLGISIHALRVEGDLSYLPSQDGSQDFYPRPPGGGRHIAVAV